MSGADVCCQADELTNITSIHRKAPGCRGQSAAIGVTNFQLLETAGDDAQGVGGVEAEIRCPSTDLNNREPSDFTYPLSHRHWRS